MGVHLYVHVNGMTAVFQLCLELGAVVSWQYERYYQFPTVKHRTFTTVWKSEWCRMRMSSPT